MVFKGSGDAEHGQNRWTEMLQTNVNLTERNGTLKTREIAEPVQMEQASLEPKQNQTANI